MRAARVVDPADPPTLDGPTRILAGPGTGKTRALVNLRRRAVAAGTPPERVWVLTFSRRAAEELRERIAETAPAAHALPAVLTFHALAIRVLRSAGWSLSDPDSAAGDPQERAPGAWRLLGGLEEWVAMRTALERSGGTVPRWRSLVESPVLVDDALAFASRCQQALVGPGLLAQRLASAPGALQELAVIAAHWEDVQRDGRFLNFPGLVAAAVECLQTDPALLRGRLDVLLVDEYQDTDRAQGQLVRALADRLPAPCRLAVVGDPRQAIYGFRGANPANLLEEFSQAFHPQVWRLRTGWRCPGPVMAAADAVCPPDEQSPAVEPAPGLLGPAVEIWRAADEVEEGLAIARAIQAEVLAGATRYGEVAVLVRSAVRQAPALLEACRAVGVPCTAGRGPAEQAPATATVLAWLRALARPDDGPALVRALTQVPGGLPPGTVARLRRLSGACAFDLGRAFWWAAQGRMPPAGTGGLRVAATWDAAAADPARDPLIARLDPADHRAIATLAGRLQALDRVAAAFRQGPLRPEDARRLVGQVAWRCGMLDAAEQDPWVAAALGDLGDAAEAVAAVETELRHRPPALSTVLDRLQDALGRGGPEPDEAPPPADAVQLLTIHQAKGLQFPQVFVAGCARGLLPAPGGGGLLTADQTALLLERLPELEDVLPQPEARLEEERRLLFVALTRAGRRAVCTYALSYGEQATEASTLLEPLRAAGVVERAAPTAERVTRQELEAELAVRWARLAAAGAPAARAALAAVAPTLDPVAVAEACRPHDPVEGPPVRVPDPVPLSASALGEWLACPRRLYFDRVIPDQPSTAATRGIAAHRLLEAAYAREAEWQGDPAAFARCAGRLLRTEVLPGMATEVSSPLELRALEAWLRALVRRYAHHAVAAEDPGDRTLATEAPFELRLGAALLRGRIDRVRVTAAGRLEVIDYKTTTNVPSARGLRARVEGDAAGGPRDWQLLVYHLAMVAGEVTLTAEATGDPTPALLRNWYVGSDPPVRRDPDRPLVRRGLRLAPDLPLSPVEAREVEEVAPERLAALGDQIAAAAAAIRQGRFPAQPRHDERTCLAVAAGRGCARADCCDGVGSVGRGHPVPGP